MQLDGMAEHRWDHDIVIQAHTELLYTSTISTYSSLRYETKKKNNHQA